MKEGKLTMVIGPPGSGKSTLASEVHTKLKKDNINSIFVSEAATDYIAEYGIPKTPMDQMIIFYKQMNRELMFIDSKEHIICDSSSILNYFYFRGLFDNKLKKKDIACINHLQKEILKHINKVYKIYYVPNLELDETSDGIRFHNKEEIKKIGNWIKSYLEIENIEHIDLGDVDISKRADFIYNDLKYKKSPLR